MSKNTNKTKKPGKNNNLKSDSLIEKQNISLLSSKSFLKQRSLNQIRHYLTGHTQIRHHFFIKKELKYFNDFHNRNFPVLWLKWTQTMEMKQNQKFFHETFKSDVIYIFIKKIKVFQWLSKPKFLSFMTEVNSSNASETKSNIFSWDIFKSDIIFHWSHRTKIFQWFSQLPSFSFIAKVSTNKN